RTSRTRQQPVPASAFQLHQLASDLQHATYLQLELDPGSRAPGNGRLEELLTGYGTGAGGRLHPRAEDRIIRWTRCHVPLTEL
ncbi:hypothetical protein, partial [Streptomyces sp. NPDC047009]|uniref:hypothetical protein n=1 Tax=Streptomyces sp. NPDC047009 TaxID=3154496 RepID=UPI0033E57AB4